ncbi:hypothetical protein [Streptomyces sp. NPDC055709]
MSNNESQSLIRIEITADTLAAAEQAADGICRLWLSSASTPRPVPGEGFSVTIHANINSRPEDAGFAIPTCPHLDHD